MWYRSRHCSLHTCTATSQLRLLLAALFAALGWLQGCTANASSANVTIASNSDELFDAISSGKEHIVLTGHADLSNRPPRPDLRLNEFSLFDAPPIRSLRVRTSRLWNCNCM